MPPCRSLISNLFASRSKSSIHLNIKRETAFRLTQVSTIQHINHINTPAMSTPEQKKAVVCVFCGSSAGTSPAHLAAARELAHLFHKQNITLVYGGGTAGIMGEISRTLVSLSGPESVHGIIPSALVRVEDGHQNTLTASSTNSVADTDVGKKPERIVEAETNNSNKKMEDLLMDSDYGMTTIVPDMHTRKRMMADKVINGGPGSGFVALAGGFGTLEEVMEMVTWNQLGIHNRGIVLVNIEGYWDGILEWVRNSVKGGFVSDLNMNILVECKDVAHALDALQGYRVSEGRYSLDWEEVKKP